MILYNKGTGEYQNFLITEDCFDEYNLGKTETIMCQGNGYMCIRGTAEENYPKKTANTFIAGTFNKGPGYEPTELPNTADTFSMEIIIDGKRFFLTEDNVMDYDKTLNLKTGELTRTFKYQTKDNLISFEFTRFVSADNLHLAAQRVKITPLNKDAQIVIISGIDSKTTNSGEAHFIDDTRRFFEKRFIFTKLTTTQSKIDFFINAAHRIFLDDVEDHTLPQPLMNRREAFQKYSFDISVGSTLTIEKYITYYTSIDNKNVACEDNEKSYLILKDIMEEGYEALLKESMAALDTKLWSRDAITIRSKNEFDQLAINYAMYHLFAMTPAHDPRMNIGAKGLSGEGYKGHAFWDTEVFLLPRYIVQNPEVAKSLIEYRYHGLEGARKKAKENGFEGAMFPWEAANPEDGEVTPIYGGMDVYTGERERIKTGFIEIHITSDVAFGVYSYFNFTGDQEFMDNYGYEILLETASFWSSRLETSKEDDLLHITNVIGPDEYTEHIDDNAYTNYLAKWNMDYAVKCYNDIKANRPEVYARLAKKIGLTDEMMATIAERASKVYIPVPGEDLIIDQDTTYRALEEIDLTKYRNNVMGILKDYNLDQISKFKVSKQADIMVLFLLFGENWSNEIKAANFNYYEPYCLHDSSLSFSTHCILANDIGNTTYSYELFKKATTIDLGQDMKSCDAGVHAASYGGIWQCVINGFAGLRMIGTDLHFNPRLPEEIQGITFNMIYKGQTLKAKIEKEEITLTNLGEETVTVFVKGEEVTLQNGLNITR